MLLSLCSQEFTSVYRMHMLLPESFTVRRADGSSDGTLWSGQTFLAGARKVMVSVVSSTVGPELGNLC